jgi:hypothetical protein
MLHKQSLYAGGQAISISLPGALASKNMLTGQKKKKVGHSAALLSYMARSL